MAKNKKKKRYHVCASVGRNFSRVELVILRVFPTNANGKDVPGSRMSSISWNQLWKPWGGDDFYSGGDSLDMESGDGKGWKEGKWGCCDYG